MLSEIHCETSVFKANDLHFNLDDLDGKSSEVLAGHAKERRLAPVGGSQKPATSHDYRKSHDDFAKREDDY